MDVRVKICGLTKPQDVDATAQAGAAYAGFVFFPKSPRHVAIDTARDLAVLAPIGLAKVALVVNADDALLDEITGKVAIDILQLHGSESPQRVSEIRARYGLPVMKAVGVASAGDVQNLATYEQVCDQILVDAKAPKGAALPGGNGLAFDWKLIAGRRWARPWMLAGGLTPENVARAVELTGAAQVDVSSGVESAPGQKDVAKIAAFVSAATSSQEIPKL
ncbi:MAG: phosphoribosylanthranilate isomerase [Pelagimonas sp.]|uniref:phosphoribosylanthranilate isomerase n=1 Tax=Pelagimonas sp. TaxID=2073170 RepID=UPI003D6A98AA